jgi:hypothetical protein
MPGGRPSSQRLGEGPAKTQDDVRALSSGRHARRKAVWRSRNRGCNGHRILRRVPVGGRHLRLSRAISFHEKVVTAALAASSHERAIRLARVKATKETRRRSGSRGRGRGDRGVRGSVGSRHRGKTTPTLGTPASERPARGFEARQCVASLRLASAFSSVVKTLGTPV